MKVPKISFLISSYNAANFLDRCIRDLMCQTEQDFEAIVVDPMSPTKDIEIAERWAEKDSRIRPIKVNQYQRYGESWMTAWENAQSPYVANCNTDDLRYPHYAEEVIKCLDNNPKVGFCYGGLVITDENGTVLGTNVKLPYNREVFERECHGGPAVGFRRDLYCGIAETGLAKSMRDIYQKAKLYFSAFDYYLWCNFISRGYEGYSIPKILSIYTQRKNSIENSSGHMSTWQSLCIIGEFFPDALDRISDREGNDLARHFKTFPMVPESDSFGEALRGNKIWDGNKVNVLEL